MGFFKTFLIRYIKYFLIGLGALLVVEVGGMIYINNYYLADDSAYSVVKVIKAPSVAIKYKRVAISPAASQTEGSYDGRYIASLQNGTVYITDLVSGDKTTVAGISGMMADHFQWLYDRDWLAIAEKSTGSAGSLYVKLYSYDITSKTMTEIRDNNTNHDLKIPISSGNDSVGQIDMSTETGVTYLKIADQSGISRLWKINSFVGTQRMSNTVTGNIGRILCLKTSDSLLYEDRSNGRVYQYNTASSLRINGTRNLKLLGIDNADNVYLAAMNNGRTDTVYYGSVSAGTWNTVSLSKAVDPAGIYVTCSGEIYLNDSVKSSISKLSAHGQGLQTDSNTSKSSSNSENPSSSVGQPGTDTYQGTLLNVFDNGFFSIESGCVVHNEFS